MRLPVGETRVSEGRLSLEGESGTPVTQVRRWHVGLELRGSGWRGCVAHSGKWSELEDLWGSRAGTWGLDGGGAARTGDGGA